MVFVAELKEEAPAVPVLDAAAAAEARARESATLEALASTTSVLQAKKVPRVDPQASAAHSRHLPGQKLRLGGDALGAGPTYLLYLAYRSRGELRRIDLGPGCAGATWSDFAAPELTRKPLPRTSWARSFDLEVTR